METVKKVIMKQTVEYMIQQASLGVERFMYDIHELNSQLASEKETHFVFKPDVPIQLSLF